MLTIGGGLLLAGLIVFIIVHMLWYIRPSQLKNVDEFQARLRRGRPVVVHIYSNLCTVCTLSKPLIDRVEARFEGRAEVLRVDLLSRLGRQIADKYRVTLIPAVLVFDSEGKLANRQLGVLNPLGISRTLGRLLKE
jgi:thiol-disulfide isomerase/thioredoxin